MRVYLAVRLATVKSSSSESGRQRETGVDVSLDLLESDEAYSPVVKNGGSFGIRFFFKYSACQEF